MDNRFVPLPERTYNALRLLWSKHQHPRLLFPNAAGSMDRISSAATHMEKGRDGTSREVGYRGGTQRAMKVLLSDCGIKKKRKKRSPSTPCATPSPPICLNGA